MADAKGSSPAATGAAGGPEPANVPRKTAVALAAEGAKPGDYASIIRPGLTEWEKRAHSRSLNLNRRHLTQTQQREIIADQLRETPQKSNRQIAEALGVSHHTVAPVRKELESIGQIAQCSTVETADGRQYPATRKPSIVTQSRKEAERAVEVTQDAPPELLAGKLVDVKRAERRAREHASEQRATSVSTERAGVGSCDRRHGDFREALADVAGQSGRLTASTAATGRNSCPGATLPRERNPTALVLALTPCGRCHGEGTGDLAVRSTRCGSRTG